MQNKRRLSSAIICAVMLIALVMVPLFALSASAAEASVTKTGKELTTLAGVSTSSNGGSVDGKTIELDEYVTVKFDKAGAGTAPAYYSESIRLYQNGGTLTITATDAVIKNVSITAGSSSYNGNNGKVSAGSLSIDDTAVTISDVGEDSVVFTTAGTRLYVKSLTVTYDVSATACAHADQSTETVEATCTEDGYEIITCNDCGKELSNEILKKLGHNYVDGVCTECGVVESAEPKWVLTDISKIKANDIVVIAMTKNGNTYAMSNDKGTGSAPAAVLVTVDGDELDGDIAETIKWNISYADGSFNIYPNGVTSNALYCTATNNGVRVGTNANKAFTIDAASGYIKNTATNRYLGVYNSQDWRCYTSPTTANIANQTFGFYVYTEPSVVDPDAPVCEHANQSTIKVDATCTVNGSITVKCDDCGDDLSVEAILATNHANKTTTTVDATCTVDGSVTVTCDDCGVKLSESVIKAHHTYIDGVCDVCGEIEPDYSGRYYIAAIRSEGNYFWMTSDLGDASTKRYQIVDSGLTELPAEIEEADGTVFVVVKNGDGTYSICAEDVDGNNYLGWTSGNSGILVEEADALKLTIDENDDGTLAIHFTGDVERYLALNSNPEYAYFAWYKSGQCQNLSLVPVVEPVEPEAPEYTEPTITGAQVNVGENLAIKYHVYIPDGEYTSVILKVTNEGHGTYAELEGTLVEDGTYVFVYDNIAPQCMSDLLDAYLIIDGETVATVEDYSIVQNAKNLANDNPEDTELKQFLADLLAYGMAAQLYTGYEVTITEADIAAIGAASNNAPAESSVSLGDRTAPDKAYIAGAGVRFDSEVQIFVAIAGANAAEAKVVVNGEKYDVVDGKAYLPAMSLTELSASVEIALELDGEPVHTVTYGFYTYAYQMSIAGDAAMANLALALYNCAESAKAYLD